ncbi:MAG: hypothetical protein QM820_39575 [Minicystis sp.]
MGDQVFQLPPLSSLPVATLVAKCDTAGLLDRIDTRAKLDTAGFAVKQQGVVVGQPKLRRPHAYTGQRPRQEAKHLAATLLRIVKDADIKEDEIQIMSIGNVHVLTSNHVGAVQHLYGKLSTLDKESFLGLLDAHIQRLAGAARCGPNTSLDAFIKNLHKLSDYSEIRFCSKLVKALRTDTRHAEGILHSLKDMSTFKGEMLEASGPEDAARMLKDGGYDAHRLIILKPEEGLHAEQNFVLVLLAMGADRPKRAVQIYGSKRPCYMCSACLHYAREHLHNVELTFSHRQGPYWQTAAASFVSVASRFSGSSADTIAAWFDTFRGSHGKKTYISQTQAVGKSAMTVTKREDGKWVVLNKTGGNFASGSESEMARSDQETLYQQRRAALPPKTPKPKAPKKSTKKD